MRFSSVSNDILRRVRLAVAVTLTACGGSVSVSVAPGGAADGASQADVSAGAIDATTCLGACSDVAPDSGHADDGTSSTDGPSDAPSSADASDASTDAAAFADYDGPAITHDEACHVIWPQAAAYNRAGDSIQIRVDATGNTYVAIGYSSDPPLDLGVASPGYPIGMTVAKLDPQCHLLWAHTIGGPVGTEMYGTLAAAPSSGAVLAGTFNGAIDFGASADAGPDAGTESGYEVGYVLRLDADGNPIFHRSTPADFPSVVGVAADDTAWLLFFDYGAFECTADPSLCDGGAPDSGLEFYSLVQIDPAGSELSRRPFPGFPGVVGLGPATFTDLALDPTGTIWAIDNDADGGPAVQRLTTSGVALWSQRVGTSRLALGPTGGVDFAQSGTTPATQTFSAFGYDGGVAWTRTEPAASALPGAQDFAVDPAGNLYLAGSTAFDPSGQVGVEVLDPGGGPRDIRVWAGATGQSYSSFGVDRSGNAVLGGEIVDDGGVSVFVVKLAP
jgi:hypothetical protein